RDGFLDQHVKLIRKIYRERRDMMLQALQEFFPPAVTWTHPHGGLFLWVTRPAVVDIKAILKCARGHTLAFVPGNSFYATAGPNHDGGEGYRHMRLNFSNAAPDHLREGIRR